jgi:hypothetical protein
MSSAPSGGSAFSVWTRQLIDGFVNALDLVETD